MVQCIISRITKMFRLNLLFVVLWACLLKSAVDACGQVVTSSGLKNIRIGVASSGADDAESVAFCPPGTLVSECYCSDEAKCDGVTITGRNCRAFNQGSNPAGIQAIAICLTAPASDYTVARSTDTFMPNTNATCPSGFRVESCSLHNPWSNGECRQPLITQTGRVCTSQSPCEVGCRATAVCKRV